MGNSRPHRRRFPFGRRRGPLENSCAVRAWDGVPRAPAGTATGLGREPVPTSSAVGRIAAVLALVGAAIVVLLLVLGGGSSYTVTAEFENASQLVTGNNVDVAGVPVGSVKQISLSDDGQALVKLEISDSAYAPLPEGTHATVRSQSLSGIANRYVDLALPTHNTDQKISSGGQITQADTTSEVDLDQLFNTLDKPTV